MSGSQALNLVVQASAALLDVLSRSRHFLEDVLGDSDDYVVIVNRDFRILWANQRVKDLWQESFVNQCLLDRIPAAHHAELKKCIARLRQLNQDIQFEAPLVKDTDFIPCFWSARYVDARTDGPIAHEIFCLSGTDITTLSVLKREASLKHEYQRLMVYSEQSTNARNVKELLGLTLRILSETNLLADEHALFYSCNDGLQCRLAPNEDIQWSPIDRDKLQSLSELNPSRPLSFEGCLASYGMFSADTALTGALEILVPPRALSDKELERLMGAVFNTFAAAWARIRYREHQEGLDEYRSTKVAVGFLQRSLFGTSAAGDVQIFPFYMPTDRCGGDWYSVYPSTDGCSTLYLADVTGHGIGAALVAAYINGLVRSIHETSLHLNPEQNPEARLKEVLSQVSSAVFDTYEGRFLSSMIALELIPASREVVMVNAGHVAPMVYSAAEDSVGVLLCASNLMGLSRHPQFDAARFQLNKGDSLLIYSDGVIEHNGGHAMRLDRRELRRLFLEFGRQTMSWDDLTDRLQDYLPCQLNDDVTALALQFSL